MKKPLSVLLAICAMLSLCSCKDTTVEEPEYTLLADFGLGESEAFYAADGWANDVPFNCTWKSANCKAENGIMKMIIDKRYDGSYTGAEYRTHEMYGYGLYEVSMKPIKNDGVVSSFLRQYRIIIVVRLRSQIFRQIVQIERRRAAARQAKFVQYGGKYASKRAAKALAGNCAVLP